MSNCEHHGAYKVRCLLCDDVLCGYCFEEIGVDEDDEIDEDAVALCVGCKERQKLREWNEWAKERAS